MAATAIEPDPQPPCNGGDVSKKQQTRQDEAHPYIHHQTDFQKGSKNRNMFVYDTSANRPSSLRAGPNSQLFVRVTLATMLWIPKETSLRIWTKRAIPAVRERRSSRGVFERGIWENPPIPLGKCCYPLVDLYDEWRVTHHLSMGRGGFFFNLTFRQECEKGER